MRVLVTMVMCLVGIAASADPVRLLVITGSHPFDARFYGLFEGHPNIEWDKKTQSSKPCAAYTEDFAESYDVVLLYDFESTITDEQKKHFEAAFGDGRGLIVLHHALCNHPGWPTFREIGGGQFFFQAQDEHEASSFAGNVEVTYTPVSHPITEGVEAFTVIEEPYKNVYRPENAEPLMTSENPESDEVVAWTTMHEKSRVVTIEPGHGWQIFEDPNYKRFLAQAILWAAGREGESE